MPLRFFLLCQPAARLRYVSRWGSVGTCSLLRLSLRLQPFLLGHHQGQGLGILPLLRVNPGGGLLFHRPDNPPALPAVRLQIFLQ